LIVLSRQFVSPNLASWSAEGGHLHWAGHWEGLSALYDPSTLGLAWLCLFLSVGLWFALPARRRVVLWIVAVVLSATAALSGVFACFVGLLGLAQVLNGYVYSEAAPRYLFPMLVAWCACLMTLTFAESPSLEPGKTRSPARRLSSDHR
jgi:hypothetical protein